LSVDAGVRGEVLRTGAIPTDGYARPFFPAQTIWTANPKVAASYGKHETRLHSSLGTGIRPPAGFDLAYTNNPDLKPERTRSFDAGVERKLLHGMLALDATYFYNRFYDLIVTLGGNLSALGFYETENLANSRAQGAEFTAQLRPARWVFLTGWYTYLDSEILGLNGAPAQAPDPFQVGEELLRRPANSGAAMATFTRGKATANVEAYFRGRILDVEPTYGATDGLYWNAGYTNVGINVNYAMGHGVTAYGNLRNALDEHYEEVFGYPSPRLNFVAGLKWAISRAQ
jgi:outer membrane receptor protein involved in Fe transport